MDSEYLQNTVGKALTECLAEVCLKRPLDPIEYIALWLYKHDKNLKLQSEEDRKKKEIEKLKKEKLLEKERLERLYIERVRLEDEERERIKDEIEMQKPKIIEEKPKEFQPEKKEENDEEIANASRNDFMIEIGIKRHSSRPNLDETFMEKESLLEN